MEEEVGLLSLGDFFKVVFNRKWIVIAVTVVALILGTVLTMFVINPSKLYYQLYFSMEYPGKGSVYPDGKAFYFQDMISLEYLNAVKQSDERFASVDVERISNVSGISIYDTSIVEGSVSNANLSINDKLYEYRIVVKAKCFPNEELANEFLRALAAYPAQYNRSALESVDFKKNLQSYNSPSIKKYEEKLAILNNEYNYLVSNYNSLISVYGDSLTVNDKQLSVWLNELNTAYGSYDRQMLSETLKLNGYTFDAEATKNSNDTLVYQLHENTVKIETLRSELNNTESSSGTSVILSQINELQAENINIRYILNYRGVTVTESTDNRWSWQYSDGELDENFVSASAAYGAKLDDVKAKLEEQADICKSVMMAAYGQQARTLFSSTKLEQSGTSSVAMAAVLSLLIGLIAVAAVVLIIDMPKYAGEKRAKLEAKQAGLQPAPAMVQGEQLDEAAAAKNE